MLRYLQAQIGLVDTPLKEAVGLTQQLRGEFTDAGIGLGWSITGSNEKRIYAHNGGTGGYRTFAAFSLEEQRGVVVMTNSTESPDDIGRHLMLEDFPLAE